MIVRSLVLFAFVLVSNVASAQDVELMPDVHGLPVEGATACARGDVQACVALGDGCLRSGDGSRANALYHRAADLARHAMHVPGHVAAPGRIRTVAAAVGALEAAWNTIVVRGAGARGHRATAEAARDQVFGAQAVASWTGRRARISDAFRSVHTMTFREGGTFADHVWIGSLRTLAGDGPCWELRFAYESLDFTAYLDDTGRVLAIVHVPEG